MTLNTLYHFSEVTGSESSIDFFVNCIFQPACPCGPHKGYICAANMGPMGFKWVLTGFQVGSTGWDPCRFHMFSHRSKWDQNEP